jgi:3-phosphoshikimate 1-carboxyvinyltransferase
MNLLTLAPATRAQGTIALPGSKSLSIRALLLAALADGETLLENMLNSDDTQVMRGALQALGTQVSPLGGQSLGVCGSAVFARQQADIFVGNSGLSARTLAAALARMPGRFRLHGVPRMHERPIGDLVESLQLLGATVVYEATPGYPPLTVTGAPDAAVPVIRVRGTASSQYLTGLLQVAPLAAARQDVTIEVEGELISKPYVDMTIGLMRRFGVTVSRDGYRTFTVPQGSRYVSPGSVLVEGDASTASYFLAAGAIGHGPVRVTGAGKTSVQGDMRFADFLRQVGVDIAAGDDWVEARGRPDRRIGAFDQDFNHIPDAAMTAAVLALYADGPCRLRNIGSWRVKETDRLAAMATELAKCGAAVEQGDDWLRIVPPAQVPAAQIATYDDHRMAMSFSLARFSGAAITIENPECTAKTFPAYFKTLEALVS